MITQNVANGCQLTTVNSNDITAVNFSDGYYYFFIRNDSEKLIIRASTTDANCSEDGDGVLSILPGQSAGLYGSGNSLLFVSSGPCIIAASNNAINPFKNGKKGGDKAKLGTIPDITSNGPVIAADYQLDGITDFIVNVPDSCEIADIGTITENGIVKAADYELDGILSFDVQVKDPHSFADKNITENGSYSAEAEGVSGYSNVNVNIVDPHSFSEKNITENGDYNAENDGVSGFSRVSVNVPDPHTFKAKNINANGTYYADTDGASGYSSVNVNVTDPHTFTDITITENGSYSAENAGASGFSNVEVDVTDPHTFKTRDIIANGTYNASSDNCSGYSSVNVNVPDPHSFAEKTITKNGTYTAADSGVSGFSSVSVNIPLTSKDITSNGAYVNSGGGWNTLNVNVPDPHTFTSRTINSNGTYNASDDNVSGFSSVNVNVPLGVHTAIENGTYYASNEGLAGFSRFDVCVEDPHTFGSKTVYSGGTYNSADDGLSGFSSVYVNCDCKGTYRTYLYDECRLVNTTYAYYGSNSSVVATKSYVPNKKCPSSVVLDETKRDYWYFTPTAIDCENLEKIGKTYKGIGLSFVFYPGASSKVRISCGPSEDVITYSNIVDISNYKKANNPSDLLYDIIIPIDDIYNNGATGNVWDTSYRFLKFEAVDGSIITFNRVWLNTLSTLSCTNPNP